MKRSTYGMVVVLLTVMLFLFQTSEILAETLEEGARREGKVMFYTAIPIQVAQVVTSTFQKLHPFIRAEYLRVGAGANLLGKVSTEKRMGQVFSDVLGSSGIWAEVYKKEQLLAKYISPEAKSIPQGFKDPEGFWTGNYTAYYAFIYNTRIVGKKDVPKTYEDLLHPKWKGKIGISSNSENWFMGMLELMGEEKGTQYMAHLADQNPIFRNGNAIISSLMTAGEFPLALSVVHTTREQQRAGAPVDIMSFPTPTLADVRWIGISAGAPHPNAAKLFVDFLLSKESQKIFNQFNYHPVRMDVQVMDPVVEEIRRNLFPIKTRDAEVVEDYKRKFNKIFKIRR